jgi:transcriptional regulator with XRE-family HTH domain/KaiC/GvpD/RAD55 family RecA-like ATPase
LTAFAYSNTVTVVSTRPKGGSDVSDAVHPSPESTGIPQLDQILGGLFIGDNVIWYDDAGSLAPVFCLNLIEAAHVRKKPVIYVSFDRSPKNLMDKLGRLSDSPALTVLDGFTHGKGAGADVFLQFYKRRKTEAGARMLCLEQPHKPKQFSETLYQAVHAAEGDVRLIFESLTGMQELWGGEEHVIRFYSRACPRLYELNTIAYWLIEKAAHTPRLKSSINQIAQVVVDLSVKRGKTLMTIIKAERQATASLNKPLAFLTRETDVRFESQDRASGPYDLGDRLKALRLQKGFSQTELARLVGVTASTVSQIESNLIFPSLPALYRISEIMSVEISAILGESTRKARKVVFSKSEALPAKLTGSSAGDLSAWLLTSGKTGLAAEPHIIEIPPHRKIGGHFTARKAPEIGYVLFGRVSLTVDNIAHTADTGDAIYLDRETPQQWENPGSEPARLLWVTLL